MIILPAIDIKGGRCVRLCQGDYETAQQVADDALLTAKGFAQAGAVWLHMVDLDGAKEKKPINGELIKRVARESDLKVEVGGGVRDMATVEDYLKNGLSRVILGSAALKDFDFLREALAEFGKAVAVGIDARESMVAVNGWLETSQVHYLELARRVEDAGAKTIIYTDIGRDGTLAGVNLDELESINEAVSCRIIASGGVRDIGDVAALRAMGIYGAICGKSLYQGTLTLMDAIATAQEE